MSDYENRPVAEGINYSRENPLKEFFLLVVAALAALAVVLFLLSLLAQKLAPLIPFSVEAELAERMTSQWPDSPSKSNSDAETYLRELADRLLASQAVPEGLSLKVHYAPGDTVNAFATLGGHIYIFEGLIREAGSENALAMVVAHEIAHILHRDPIVAMGRGLTVSLALASLSGLANTGAVDWLLQQVGLVTVMSFTREQERAADALALAMVQAHYGNVAGAETIFRHLASQHGEPPELFNTHPLSQERIDAIREYRERHPQTGEPRPLPSFFLEGENP